MNQAWGNLLVVGALGLALAQPGAARAAGPYEGNWSGSAAGTPALGNYAGSCAAQVTFTVTNNAVKGTVVWVRTTPTQFTGTIAADGSFKSSTGWITGKFDGASFAGSFSVAGGNCNPYRLTMRHS